jgi:hypothetical protein
MNKRSGIYRRIIIMLAKKHMAFQMLTYPGYLHQRVDMVESIRYRIRRRKERERMVLIFIMMTTRRCRVPQAPR